MGTRARRRRKGRNSCRWELRSTAVVGVTQAGRADLAPSLPSLPESLPDAGPGVDSEARPLLALPPSPLS